MKKNIEGVGEVLTPSTPKEKIQNFWYHYKWHTLVSFVLVIAILVCSLQFCTRESYDAYVLYAGGKMIGRTSENGDVAEIATVITSLKRIGTDFDGDGEVKINFSNYYFLSGGEEADLSDVNDALLANDRQALSSVLEHSEYYLCFMSVAAYEQYRKVGDAEHFVDITEYKDGYPDINYYSDSAIYLHSTGAGKLPGLSNLPEDTVICIRRPSVLGAKSEEHVEHFENARKMLENILDTQI